MVTEQIHCGHLCRILRPSTPLRSLDLDLLQGYIGQRCKTVAPYTCRKELGTLHQVWAHAKARGRITGDFPKQHLRFPKSPEKPPFQTYEQIEHAIRNGADEDLWDSLFLRETEVLGLLTYVQEHANHGFAPPMVALAALGLRRSEILRSVARGHFGTTWEAGQEVQWHLTALPPLLKRILKLQHLSPTLYTRLTKAAA